MSYVWIAVIIVLLVVVVLSLAVRVVKQDEQGVLFRLGKVIGVRQAGLTVIIPFVDVLTCRAWSSWAWTRTPPWCSPPP